MCKQVHVQVHRVQINGVQCHRFGPNSENCISLFKTMCKFLLPSVKAYNPTVAIDMISGMVKRSTELDLEPMLIPRNERRKTTRPTQRMPTFPIMQESENVS